MSQILKLIMKLKQNNVLIRSTIILLVVLSFITFTSCKKVTKTNYDKIQNGMTIREVKEILGEEHDIVVNIHNDEYYWFADARSIEEAMEKAEEGKYCDYIIVVFSVELTDNSQIVLNKKMGNTKEMVE